MRRTRLVPAAVLVAAGGVVHLQLWLGGYRGIPVIGSWFVANAVASAVIALALLVTGNRRVAAAGLALSVSSLAALVLSRTVGLFGFLERTWTDQAVAATGAEVGAVVALALGLVVASRPEARPAPVLAEVERIDPRRAA